MLCHRSIAVIAWLGLAIHRLHIKCIIVMDARVTSAFTRVFDAPCPGMTSHRCKTLVLLRAPFELQQGFRRHAEAMPFRALNLCACSSRRLARRFAVGLPARRIVGVNRHRAAVRTFGAPIPLAGFSLWHGTTLLLCLLTVSLWVPAALARAHASCLDTPCAAHSTATLYTAAAAIAPWNGWRMRNRAYESHAVLTTASKSQSTLIRAALTTLPHF